MAKRRGFFAELNHQAQLAERRRQQQARASYREQAAAQRAAIQAQRSAERAQASAARMTEQEQKAAAKEAARLHVESQLAEVVSRNAQLEGTYADIDGLLAATLATDDWVDLEDLRTLHEIFEADRIGRIHSISLTVDTEPLDAATGNLVTAPLVVVAADRAGGGRRRLPRIV